MSGSGEVIRGEAKDVGGIVGEVAERDDGSG